MAREYAPSVIVQAGKLAVSRIPTARFSGVLGDKAHTYGYHRARNALPKTDYSVKLPADKLGPGWAASALDLSFSTAMMKVVTKRLKDSAEDPNDPRMGVVREFYGTLNGSKVFGYTHTSEEGFWQPATSDSSHLWHIHVSFFRKYAENASAINGVIDVMAGIPYGGGKSAAKPAKNTGVTVSEATKEPVKLITGKAVKYASDTTTLGGVAASTNYYVLDVRTRTGRVEKKVDQLTETLDEIQATLRGISSPEVTVEQKAAFLKGLLGDSVDEVVALLSRKEA